MKMIYRNHRQQAMSERFVVRIAKMLGSAVLVFTFLVTSSLSATPKPGSPRVIDVIADSDNIFKIPGQKKAAITVQPGEKIIVRITSHFGGEKARDGSVHSFVIKKLREQGWDIRLKEGTQDYPLVAPLESGEYLIECTVKCGPGHDDMNMKLIVKN